MSQPTRDLEGKHVVVTGANTGIGRVTAEKLAGRGASVVLACRSEERTKPVLEGIRAAGGDAAFLALDLGDLASVKKASEELLAKDRPIDVLVNNAGLAGTKGLTKDGFEIAFGTNHVGHFSLTVRVMKLLRAAKAARIVNVASKAHYEAKGIDFEAVRQPTKSVAALPEYAVSKLANVLFTRELARRVGSEIRSYSLHPGVVASDVWREVPWPLRSLMKLFMISNEEGAATTLHCATSPEVANDDGDYYDKCKKRTANPVADDAALAKKLWEESAKWTSADL